MTKEKKHMIFGADPAARAARNAACESQQRKDRANGRRALARALAKRAKQNRS